jgi:hypothetical protein
MDHISEATAARLAELFGEPAVDRDATSALFNHAGRGIPAPEISALARDAKQVVGLSVHAPGDTATIGDRTYVFGEDGKWHRQEIINGAAPADELDADCPKCGVPLKIQHEGTGDDDPDTGRCPECGDVLPIIY